MLNPGMGLTPQAAYLNKQKKKKCKHCGGEFLPSQFKRWHGVNCLKALCNDPKK